MENLITAFHQLTPAEQVEFAAFAAKELPARGQVELVRVLAKELSFSYGADSMARGCHLVESDLDDEDATVAAGLPYIPQYDRRVVQLNPELWSN